MQSNFYCLLTLHLFNTEITNTRHIILQATHTTLADSGRSIHELSMGIAETPHIYTYIYLFSGITEIIYKH